MAEHERRLDVPILARVEGEGALHVTVRGDRVGDARLRIYEPPRLFEAVLRGRHFTEPVDITSRICGICPIAYQMSAVQAMEDLCEVELPPESLALRRLLYCGEWIESHVLHIALLHAPDFLGYDSGIAMAADFRAQVELALRLKRAGNRIVEVVGGRAIHPVNVKVGGFHRVPRRAEVAALADELAWAADAAVELGRWVGGFPMPELEQVDELVALVHPDEYPMNRGAIGSSDGLTIEPSAFLSHYREDHVPHSTALHGSTADGRRYAVGPLARFALNRDRLTPRAAALADELGLPGVVRNPFRSIEVRAVETVVACEEALRLVDAYRPPAVASVPVRPRAGVAHGATEAPRGLLYHRYEVADDGTVLAARIVPPTAQMQPVMEADLARFVEANLHLPDDELQWRCEQVIRNFDPCISCATHFLRLSVDRG